jgi:phosphoribosylformylglycinamidine cyclo-ligase
MGGGCRIHTMSDSPAPDSMTYRDAGVNIDAAESALDKAKTAIRATFGPRVLADVGAFGGLYRADGLGDKPVLVATADGVGTKVRIASAVGRYDSVGRDLVQHCINDALVQGAEPLFFLDYIGVGKLDDDMVASAVIGLAHACADHNMTLIGGETAEMPGVYPEGEFDLVGTLIGVVERDHILDGSRCQPGDVLIGLASNGLHTNGYSLARRIVEERLQAQWLDPFPGDDSETWADVLLRPHRCYLECMRPMLKQPGLHAMAHITGGGVVGNLPRVLSGLGARVSRKAVPALPVFDVLVQAGNVPRDEAWRAFNMGVGLIVVVDPSFVDEAMRVLEDGGEQPFLMGELAEGIDGVEWLD